MNELHDYLQKFTNDLQKLLKENQDDDSLLVAIKEKWPTGEPNRNFLVGLQNRIRPQESGRKSIDSIMFGKVRGASDDSSYKNGLGDMGGDGTGDRDNELKVPLEDSNKNQGK